MDRIIGIDYGTARVGVAISDPMGWTAAGLETVRSKAAFIQAARRVADIIIEKGAGKVVVGWPMNMDGTVGASAKQVSDFIGKLMEMTSGHEIEFIKWDERLSTVSAYKNMAELGISSRKRNTVVDKMAAVYILQNYLDSLRRSI